MIDGAASCGGRPTLARAAGLGRSADLR